MTAYEGGLDHYSTASQQLIDLYRDLLEVPVPHASLPVAALLLGICGRPGPLTVAVVVLGIGDRSIESNVGVTRTSR
jgi:hypothetical protein